MLPRCSRFLPCLGAGLLTALLSPSLAAQETVALRGARIVPVQGEEVPEGTLLIQGGKITALGPLAAVKVPFDAKVIDVKGKVLFPGYVYAHSQAGVDRANESLPVTPFLDVYDSIDPSSWALEELLREGVTTVHVIHGEDTAVGGVGRVIRPLGLTVEELTLRAPSGLKLFVGARQGWDRVRQRAQLREAFAGLEDHLQQVAERRFAEEEKKAGRDPLKVAPAEARQKGRALIRDEDVDEQRRNLYRLCQGRLDAWVYCQRAQDVPFALALAAEQGFLDRSTFVLGPECWRAASLLQEAKRPVVLDPPLLHRERDPDTGREVERFVAQDWARSGLPFALLPDPAAGLAERFLWYQAARCVREGLPRAAALEAITLAPARMLGVGELVGSLEPGKLADVLVLSGDPLSATTHVEQVLIAGQVVYRRDQDHRMRRLLGEEPSVGGAARGAEAHPHPEEEDGPQVPRVHAEQPEEEPGPGGRR